MFYVSNESYYISLIFICSISIIVLFTSMKENDTENNHTSAIVALLLFIYYYSIW